MRRAFRVQNARRLFQVRPRVVEQSPGNDQALNLAGAFVDVGDPTIAHPLLEQILPGNAHGTENFDTALGDLANRRTRMGLAERRLHVVRQTFARHPTTLQERQPRSFKDRFEPHELLGGCVRSPQATETRRVIEHDARILEFFAGHVDRRLGDPQSPDLGQKLTFQMDRFLKAGHSCRITTLGLDAFRKACQLDSAGTLVARDSKAEVLKISPMASASRGPF